VEGGKAKVAAEMKSWDQLVPMLFSFTYGNEKDILTF